MSDHWKKIREKSLLKHGNKCVLCGSTVGLQIYHKDYTRLGCESMDDLIPLCRDCNIDEHQDDYELIDSITQEYIDIIRNS